MIENFLYFLLYAKVQVTTIKTQNVQQTISQSPQKVWRGKVSSYSATYGGCLYCPPKYDSKGQLYFTTASGERLDDSAFTLAFNHADLGTMVSICNLTNQKCVAGKVNDRGGFENPKYNNRIADLSMATTKAIEARTDKDIIEISLIP